MPGARPRNIGKKAHILYYPRNLLVPTALPTIASSWVTKLYFSALMKNCLVL